MLHWFLPQPLPDTVSVCFQILSIGPLHRKLAGKKADHLKKPFDGGQCDGSLGRRKCKLINWNVVHVSM